MLKVWDQTLVRGARDGDVRRFPGFELQSPLTTSGVVVREVYLDYNGSSPLDPRVADVMVPVLTGGVGNASSVHRFGRRQAAAVDEAREHIAASSWW